MSDCAVDLPIKGHADHVGNYDDGEEEEEEDDNPPTYINMIPQLITLFA